MASIVQRNKSFSVVYTIYDEDKKKQKWETYHSYEAAHRRKEQLDLIQQHEKERAQYREGALAQFLEEYVLVSLIERVELTEDKQIIIKFRFRELEAIS